MTAANWRVIHRYNYEIWLSISWLVDNLDTHLKLIWPDAFVSTGIIFNHVPNYDLYLWTSGATLTAGHTRFLNKINLCVKPECHEPTITNNNVPVCIQNHCSNLIIHILQGCFNGIGIWFSLIVISVILKDTSDIDPYQIIAKDNLLQTLWAYFLGYTAWRTSYRALIWSPKLPWEITAIACGIHVT